MHRLLHQESKESSKMALLKFILRFVLSGNIIAKYREQLISSVEENDNLLSVIERWFSPEAVSSSQIKKEYSWERRDRERIRENERKKCEGKFSVSKIKLSAPFTILASDYKKSIISHKDNERYHTNNILPLMQ